VATVQTFDSISGIYNADGICAGGNYAQKRITNYIIINFEETGYDGVEWIHLAQDRDQWRPVVDTEIKR
jgi:hypothetical protein